MIEPAARPPTAWGRVVADFGGPYAASALIAFVFAASGPVAVILAVGTRGGLTQAELASWIFGAFFVNGWLSLLVCWRYRQPLVFFWTIPGAVLVGPALEHLAFAEVIGAYVATALLMLALGLSGAVKRAMQAVPMPIVMGMVAGVFLRFGTDLVRALHGDAWIALPMLAAFLVLSAWGRVGRRVPPVLGALVAGAVAVAIGGRFDPGTLGAQWLAAPVWQAPAWSWRAMVELVVPLAITVIVVQNGQGIAVLRAAGHAPPIDAVTVGCGLWSLPAAAVGAVSTCLTGPVNAIISASGERDRQYTAGLMVGALAIVFGLFAPLFTGAMLATPPAFVATLGGLAMLKVLQTAFTASFGTGRFTLGALVAFVVTVTDLAWLNIGAAFWGLIAGLAVSWLLERGDFRG